jgi:serine/threonine protein kinase
MEPNFRAGQYVFEKPLGQGGMAEVWLARNVHLGTPAAIKFLNRAYAGVSEVEQRFVNEGRRQGLLSHPNIVKVYGFEYVDGHSFLILQYVDGESLEDLLARVRRLEIAEALRLGISVLNGLDYAHNEQIVHRDIKPSNILIDKHGFPYLGDFGIVLAVDEERRTRTGTSMGTALYMSPEQIVKPGSVDRRSDIYSFGCVLYEMLAGEPPFNVESTGDGSTDFLIKTAHVQQAPPPLRGRNASVSPSIESVVMRCLAKNPEDRYATCRDLRDALSAAMVARPAPPKPPRATRAETVIEVRPPELPPKFVPPTLLQGKQVHGGSSTVKGAMPSSGKAPVVEPRKDKVGKAGPPSSGWPALLVLFACLSRWMPAANPDPRQRANGLTACLIAGLLGLLICFGMIINGKRQANNNELDPAIREKWRRVRVWGWIFVAASLLWMTDPNIWGILRGWFGGK